MSNLRDRAAALEPLPDEAEYKQHWVQQGYEPAVAAALMRGDWQSDTIEALRAQRDLLVEALEGVIRVADRRTDEFDGARAVLDAVRGRR